MHLYVDDGRDLLSCFVFSCFSCHFLLFACLFRLVSFSSIFFPFLYLLLFSLFLFSPIDLCLSCVCVVIDTTCNIYVVKSYLGGNRNIWFLQA